MDYYLKEIKVREGKGKIKYNDLTKVGARYTKVKAYLELG